MKVLAATHSFGADGAAIMLRHAIRFWTRQLGWNVDALCGEGTQRTFQPQMEECGARPLQSTDLRQYDVALVNSLVNVHRIDDLAGKRAHLPLVLWVHEGLSVVRHSQASVASWVRRYSRCRMVIYQTAWQRDEVFRTFSACMPAEHLVVVPNGIETVATLPATRRESGPFRIVCVGSVIRRKRQGDLARIVQRLSTDLPVECEFIGDLTHADSLGPEAAALVRTPPAALRWLGALPHGQTLARVAAADLLCLPSDDESFPLAPLEAAARGIPVLMSELPPYRHIGWQDGENCVLHPVGDLMHMEAQLRRLVEDAPWRGRIARAGRRLAEAHSMDRFLTGMTQAMVRAAGRSDGMNAPD